MPGTLGTTSKELWSCDDALEALMEAMRVEMIELKAKLAKMEAACVNVVITM